MLFIIILIYFLINSVLSLTNNYQLNINIDYEENDAIILFYNLTTNYSYFITFRQFGNEQLKFGLFFSSNKSEENSIEIPNQYLSTKLLYLFIICFHFIIEINHIDIECKDIRILTKISQDFLPTYKPLFIPMMYALSVLMLLPVIVQHHRHKTKQLLQRQKELRRLSVTILQDKTTPKPNFVQKLVSQIMENGNVNYENLPIDIELVSVPSTKTILDDIDNENANLAFTSQNLRPFIHKDDESEGFPIDANDCIAHLLDNTPWNTSNISQPFITRSSSSRHPSVIRDSAASIKEKYVPTIISFHDDDDDDRKPILKSTKYSAPNFYNTNRIFFESDV